MLLKKSSPRSAAAVAPLHPGIKPTRTSRKITNASLSLHDYGHDLINFNEAMPRMRNSAAIIHGIKKSAIYKGVEYLAQCHNGLLWLPFARCKD